MSKLSRRNRARSSQGEIRPFEGMRHVNPHAAGVDIGAHESMAGVPDGDDQQLVRAFGTSPTALESLADWCIDRGIQTVAMASTGVEWMPLCETLEARGIQGCLRSAQAITPVPGRQSAVLDWQWIQTLHSSGFLSASCRPHADCVALRTLRRHRAQLLEHRAPPVLHMPQAFFQRNIHVSHALSDVTGPTGQRIIRAMVAGERDPSTLAALRNSRWKQDTDEIAKALTGPWRAEPLFVLKHALALCACSTAQLSECDTQSAGACSVLTPRVAPVPAAPVPAAAPVPPRRKPHAQRKNAPEVNTRAYILRLTGVDLVAVHGSSDALAQTMLSDIGTDLSTWPDDKHCCSWLGLAPQHDLSGGTVLKSRTMKNRHRAAQACRMAAPSVVRAAGAFGACSRRLKGRLGPAQALVATAHKIARTVSHMLQDRVQ